MKEAKGKRGFGRPTKLGKFVGRDDPLALARKLEAEVKADRLRAKAADEAMQRELAEKFGGKDGDCPGCEKCEEGLLSRALSQSPSLGRASSYGLHQTQAREEIGHSYQKRVCKPPYNCHLCPCNRCVLSCTTPRLRITRDESHRMLLSFVGNVSYITQYQCSASPYSP